jgi:serine protease AprX
MLRRLIAYLCLLSLVLAALLPLTGRSAQASTSVEADTTTTPGSKLAPDLLPPGAGDSTGTPPGGGIGGSGDGTGTGGGTGSGSGTIRVVIQTNGPTTLNVEGVTQRASFDALNTVVADVPFNQLGTLAARADVAYISPDRPVKAQNLVGETTGASLVQPSQGNLPKVTGKGVTIAFIDSGISASHPDFNKNKNKTRILAAVDFTGSTVSGDPYGHGTGVASVAAGNGDGSKGYADNYAGIAPEANLIDLRVIDGNGIGTTSNTLNAINWAITNRDRFNIRIINMSLGGAIRESYKTDPLCQAVARAVNAGIVVVCSAGNYGHTTKVVGYDNLGKPIYQLAYGTITSPANSPAVITVGATDSRGTVKRSDDMVADYSSKGPTQIDHHAKPDLVAPGTRIIAAMSQNQNPTFPGLAPQNIQQPTSGNALQKAYFKYSGTSFAAPVVAGTIALMLEVNKSLTPRLVKATLLRTAQSLPGVQYGNGAQSQVSQGAGQLNAAGAVEMALAIVPDADKLDAGDHILRFNLPLNLLRSPRIGGETVAFNNAVAYSDGIYFGEHPVLTNGIYMSTGGILTDGIILTDGHMLPDGHLMSDGIILTDGIYMSSGIILTDGIILTGGIIVTDGIILTGGIILTDSLLLAGIILTDGIILTGGIIVTDGIILTGGIILTDGIYMSSGIILTD